MIEAKPDAYGLSQDSEFNGLLSHFAQCRAFRFRLPACLFLYSLSISS